MELPKPPPASVSLRRATGGRWARHVWPVALVPLAVLLDGGPLSGLAPIAAALWALAQLVAVVGLRDPARPRPPVRAKAPVPILRPEPPRVVQVIAYNCVICGRPLSNHQSMLARVGSTCIKTYGPRPAWQNNVDHDRWVDEWARARAWQVAEQARLDAQFDRAQAAHPIRVAEWEAELSSPDGTRRRSQRRRAAWVLASSLGWLSLVTLLAA